MNKPRKHHYLSQSWLALFSKDGNKPSLYYYSKDAGKVMGPTLCKRIGFENDAFSIDYKGLYARLSKQGEVRKTTLLRQTAEMACQFCGETNLSFEEQLDCASSFFEKYRGRMFETHGVASLKRFLRSVWETTVSEFPIDWATKEQISYFLASEYLWSRGYRERLRERNPNYTEEELIMDHVTRAGHGKVYRPMAAKILGCRWTILKNQTSIPFAIADNPLVILPTIGAQPTDKVDVGSSNSATLVPLSKDVLLCLDNGPIDEDKVHLIEISHDNIIQLINSLSSLVVVKEIYCGEKEPLVDLNSRSDPDYRLVEIALSVLLMYIGSGAAR